MIKVEILNSLKDYYGFEKDKEFSKFLGISSQVYSNWKSRNSFDIEMICFKCLEINPEWLISGKGEMLKRNVNDSDFQNKIKKIPFLPFQEISNYKLNNLIKFSCAGDDLVSPMPSEIDYLTDIVSLANTSKYTSGDIVACKIINVFDFFKHSEVSIGKDFIIDTKTGVLFKKIMGFDLNNSSFLLNDDTNTFEIPIQEIKSISEVVGIIRFF